MEIHLELIDNKGNKLKHKCVRETEIANKIGLLIEVDTSTEFDFWYEWDHHNWSNIRKQIKGTYHNNLTIHFDSRAELMIVKQPVDSVPVALPKIVESTCNITVKDYWNGIGENDCVINIMKIREEMGVD